MASSTNDTVLSTPEKRGGEESKVEIKIGHSSREGETRHSNPFLADGVLSKKADYILTHSTITRTELHIADPDLVREPDAQKKTAGQLGSVGSDAERNKATSGGENGPRSTAGTVAVEAEVKQSTVTAPGQQKAEEVKLNRKKKCKCCVVQ